MEIKSPYHVGDIVTVINTSDSADYVDFTVGHSYYILSMYLWSRDLNLYLDNGKGIEGEGQAIPSHCVMLYKRPWKNWLKRKVKISDDLKKELKKFKEKKMKKITMMIMIIAISLGAIVHLASCRDAQVVSRNLSEAADNFEVTRRVVFVNSIADTYLLSVVGRCSVEVQPAERQLEVTCKVGEDRYKKHHLGLSDNVTYFSEQLETKNVSKYRYKVVFKPSVIIPDIRLK